MLSSVQNRLGALSAIQPSSSTAKAGAGKFSTLLSGAASAAADTTGASSSNSGVSISNAAKAAASSSFDFDFSFNNIDHTQEEFKAHYAEGARKISEMQGLPEGQYDLTRISPKMAHVILNDMILNRGVPIGEKTVGLENFISDGVNLSGPKPIFSDVPQDAIAHVKSQQVSFPDVNGGKFGVPQESLDWLIGISRTAKGQN